MSDELLVEIKDRICFLTINRESKQNTLNVNVINGLKSALEKYENDPNVRVVCLTGAGDKTFCAGADLSGFKNIGDLVGEYKDYAEIVKKLNSYKKLTVAKVNGVCMGGGLGLALSCDLVLTHEFSTFATPEINVGLFPLIISPLIYRAVGSEKRAHDLMLTGRRISGKEAQDLGFVSELINTDEFEEETERVLKDLASKSSQVISFGKEKVKSAKKMNFEDAISSLSENLAELVQMEDAQEGISAFLEKRRPNFKY